MHTRSNQCDLSRSCYRFECNVLKLERDYVDPFCEQPNCRWIKVVAEDGFMCDLTGWTIRLIGKHDNSIAKLLSRMSKHATKLPATKDP